MVAKITDIVGVPTTLKAKKQLDKDMNDLCNAMEEFSKNTSGLRFAEGSKNCGICGTTEHVIQFERNIKRKGLPIIEIAFICTKCAMKEGLITNSKLMREE